MADQPAIQFTEIAVAGTVIHLFHMPDRRAEAASSHPTKWAFQMDIEAVLYRNGISKQSQSTGAFYRLLQRTPTAKNRALCLKHRSMAIGGGLVSEAEWDAMIE